MIVCVRKMAMAVALLFVVGPVSALSLSDFTMAPPPVIIRDFFDITGNNPDAARTDAIGSDLGMGLSFDSGANLLLFQFVNVARGGVIAEIYFDDDLGLLSTLAIYDESAPGVDFEINAVSTVHPGDLPGGNAIGFSADVALSSGADTPVPTWGVGSGERLTLSFEGSVGDPFVDVGNVVSAIETGQLRVGLHVVSIDDHEDDHSGGDDHSDSNDHSDDDDHGDDDDHDDYSESFVNSPLPPSSPNTPIPEPASLLLLGMGSTLLLIRKHLTT